MNCMKCEAKMFTALLEGFSQFPLFLSKKEKGIFGAEKRTSIKCFVCPVCGYIELRADDPASLRIPGGNYSEEE